MHKHIFLSILIMATHILGHVVPRSGDNMNGDYLISNPNLESANTFSTRFSDRRLALFATRNLPPLKWQISLVLPCALFATSLPTTLATLRVAD